MNCHSRIPLEYKQYSKSDGNVANVEMLPVPMLPIPNWALDIGIGNTGNIGNIILFTGVVTPMHVIPPGRLDPGRPDSAPLGTDLDRPTNRPG